MGRWPIRHRCGKIICILVQWAENVDEEDWSDGDTAGYNPILIVADSCLFFITSLHSRHQMGLYVAKKIPQ